MTLSEIQRLLVKEAHASFFKIPTKATKAAAKEVMADCDASATAVFVAARHILGPTFTAWEPESIWVELDPCHSNRDKLMAAISLATMPAFYWDYRVFGATTHAVNNETVFPEHLPKCTAAQMAWAAFEAELLFALSDDSSTQPEFDESVEAYVAVSLFDEGFVLPPVGLGFCEEELTKRLPAETSTLRTKLKAAWGELAKDKLDIASFDDDSQGAQLLKLTDAWLYVLERAKLLRKELQAF